MRARWRREVARAEEVDMTVKVHGRTVGGVKVVKLKVGRCDGWWYASLTLANGGTRSASVSAGEAAAWDWAAAQLDPEVGA